MYRVTTQPERNFCVARGNFIASLLIHGPESGSEDRSFESAISEELRGSIPEQGLSWADNPRDYLASLGRWAEAFNRGRPAREWWLLSAGCLRWSPLSGRAHVAVRGVYGFWIQRQMQWQSILYPSVAWMESKMAPGSKRGLPLHFLGAPDPQKNILEAYVQLEADDRCVLNIYDPEYQSDQSWQASVDRTEHL